MMSVAVLVVAAGLVLSFLSPVGVTSAHRPTSGILAPGSYGSLRHYPWWDPRHWTERSGPASTVLADAVNGVPHRGRRPRQAAQAPVRRVAELVGKRNAYTRVYRLSDGRRQAVISAVPVNYRDRGRWQLISTAVEPAVRPG